MNNLYHWANVDSMRGYYASDAIAFAPDKETAINNVLEVLKEEWDYEESNYADDDEKYANCLEERLDKVATELRSKEPSINPSAFVIMPN